MAYEYTDERREPELHAQPDVEVFGLFSYSKAKQESSKDGYYYAFGVPGRLWTSKPYGPFTTYQAALDDARRHGDCHEDYAPEKTEPDHEECASCAAGDPFEDYAPEPQSEDEEHEQRTQRRLDSYRESKF